MTKKPNLRICIQFKPSLSYYHIILRNPVKLLYPTEQIDWVRRPEKEEEEEGV